MTYKIPEGCVDERISGVLVFYPTNAHPKNLKLMREFIGYQLRASAGLVPLRVSKTAAYIAGAPFDILKELRKTKNTGCLDDVFGIGLSTQADISVIAEESFGIKTKPNKKLLGRLNAILSTKVESKYLRQAGYAMGGRVNTGRKSVADQFK